MTELLVGIGFVLLALCLSILMARIKQLERAINILLYLEKKESK